MKQKMLKLMLLFLVICLLGTSTESTGECKMSSKLKSAETDFTALQGGGKQVSKEIKSASRLCDYIFFY